MLEHNCLFRARWLEHEWLKHWIRNNNVTVTICKYCSKDASVANMEEAALTSQTKDKKLENT